MNQLEFDEGYYFGLGVFETIAIEHGIPLFLDKHLVRMSNALNNIGITNTDYTSMVNEPKILQYLQSNHLKQGSLKISVSNKNINYSIRDNPYTIEDYKRGFTVGLSNVIRNETSMLTYYKTLNYADNILEKRNAKKKGVDEPVFINTKGHLTEGAVSNIFFIKSGRIITPNIKCGLLNGIIRDYILGQYEAFEDIIVLDDIETFEEMFITNSLFGIMPVTQFDHHVFPSRKTGDFLLTKYINFCTEYIKKMTLKYNINI